MRKFYLLTLMAATALSMSAVETIKAPKDVFKADLEPGAIHHRVAVDSKDVVNAPAKISYNSETWVYKGTGKYIDSAIAACYGGTTDAVDVEVYEADGKNGLYKIVGVWPGNADNAVLYIDATDPDFVIVASQSTGITDTVDGPTYIASSSWVYTNTQGGTKEEFLSTYPDSNITLSDMIINIPASALLLNWPEAPADSKYKTDPAGWYTYGESDGAVILPGGTYVDPWSDPVDATMVETIISPLFKVDNTTPFTTQIKKKTDAEIYRVIAPWQKFFAANNIASAGPDLEIDATDPTNVIITLQSLEIGGNTDGLYNIMSYSYYALAMSTETPDEYKITLTDDGNGNSTISFPYHSCLLFAETSEKIYNACADKENLSYITFKSFAGVVDIIADKDNSNAPVEYFNLQGVRVAKPSAGQLVIRRQGSEVTKTIIR